MSPVLRPGDQVFVARRRAPERGDIVLARHPYRRDMRVIKRLVDFDERGACVLLGDNPGESTDSRSFGNVPQALIIGTVTSRL